MIGFAGPPGDEAKQIPDSAFVSGGGFGQDWMRKIPGSGRVLPSKWPGGEAWRLAWEVGGTAWECARGYLAWRSIKELTIWRY